VPGAFSASADVSTAQTGTVLQAPSSATARLLVRDILVSSKGTTAGRVVLWFGAPGDSAYNAGTDQLVWAGTFKPSSTASPGAVVTGASVEALAAGHELKLTTVGDVSLDVAVHGLEL
jgi:hypothetical protein